MRALAVILCALQLWPAVLGGPHSHQFVLGHHKQSVQVQNFAWSNCGPSSNPSIVRTLFLSPDPIVIPGELTVNVVASTTLALEAPLKAEVVLEKKLGEMWLKLPCVEDVGSCTYPDFCATLDSVIPPGQQCPEPLQSYGIPCHCPFKAGTYSLPPSIFYIPNMDLPSFLTNGDYKLQLILSNGDQQMGCLKMSFSLMAANQAF
ncbi:ganglioside GM2 activator [Tiliqua scincoides]|uniref:ganglioside GM2 activator n=1 Tax=Tiliqua scincoides TaxID=71010 RepID=UPI003462A357